MLVFKHLVFSVTSDFINLCGTEVKKLDEVRSGQVRATADGGVRAARSKSSWSVAKHKGIHKLTTFPLLWHVHDPFHYPAYLVYCAALFGFFCCPHTENHKCSKNTEVGLINSTAM